MYLAEDWKSDLDALIRLASLKSDQPTRLFQVGKVLYIPIFLEMNQEKDAVIAAVMRQVREVFDLLSY